MENIEIKRHNFDIAKNRLKNFTEKTEDEIKIDTVQIEGSFFGLGDHKVTGEELNERLGVIQNHFIGVNETSNKLTLEFREIYNVLDILDKEYITSIIANVKAIEKTNKDIRKHQNTLESHNDKLEKQQNALKSHNEKLETQQNALKSHNDKLEKQQNALKSHNEKLETQQNGLKSHNDKLEKQQNELKSHNNKIEIQQNGLKSHNDRLEKQQNELKSHNDKIEKQQNELNAEHIKIEKSVKNIEMITKALKVFKEKLEGYKHLTDIDEIWEECKTIQKEIQLALDSNIKFSKKTTEDIDTIFKSLSATEKYAINSRNMITELEVFKEKLTEISHLMEIDDAWKKIEDNKLSINNLEQVDKIHTDKLGKCEKRDEELAAAIQKNRDEVDKKIADVVQTANMTVESLRKKIKFAYWIAGGSAGLAIIELILLLMKVR